LFNQNVPSTSCLKSKKPIDEIDGLIEVKVRKIGALPPNMSLIKTFKIYV